MNNKFDPVTSTSAPGRAAVGEKVVIVGNGAGVTVKTSALVTLPASVTTVIGPVTAPTGTCAQTVSSICAADSLETPPKVTCLKWPKFAPVMVTVAPGYPLDGEKLLTI